MRTHKRYDNIWFLHLISSALLFIRRYKDCFNCFSFIGSVCSFICEILLEILTMVLQKCNLMLKRAHLPVTWLIEFTQELVPYSESWILWWWTDGRTDGQKCIWANRTAQVNKIVHLYLYSNLEHDWSVKNKSLFWYQSFVVYFIDHIFHLNIFSQHNLHQETTI